MTWSVSHLAFYLRLTNFFIYSRSNYLTISYRSAHPYFLIWPDLEKDSLKRLSSGLSVSLGFWLSGKLCQGRIYGGLRVSRFGQGLTLSFLSSLADSKRLKFVRWEHQSESWRRKDPLRLLYLLRTSWSACAWARRRAQTGTGSAPSRCLFPCLKLMSRCCPYSRLSARIK